MGIDKRLHEVEVALGFENDVEFEENNLENCGDVFNHNLYGIHITKQNTALDIDNPHICIGWSNLGDLTLISSKEELKDLYTKNNPGDSIYQRGANVDDLDV